jgi:hypothetical protein
MKYNKIKISLLVIIGAIAFTGCKKFLDVNTNPNIANDPEMELVLPSAQVAIAHVLGNQFQVNGSFWAQYWTQSPLANQYKQYDQNAPSTDNYNRSWRTLYNDGLTDLYYVYNKAKSKNNKQYMAVSRLLSAYTFQLISDAWGDAPFTEALKGLEADGTILNPTYDKQSAIYEGILAQIDEAISLIDINSPAHPGADDLIYGGDMAHWMLFAHTLKLKVALRMSEIDPTRAQAVITSIESDPAFLGYIATEGVEDAKVSYSTAGGSQNPLYSEIVGLSRTQNLFASKTCVDSMNANFDPRVFVFYKPLANGTVVGNIQGDYNNSTSASGKSIVSANVAGEAINDASATAPVRFISSYESLLLQAEAAARGWSTGDDAALYSSAIDASFEAYGVTDATEITYYKDSTYWGVYPVAGTTTDKIRHIVTQKWFSMCGNQGFEAWTESRRTGYPDFLIISVNSLIGTQKPARFLYPTDEATLNSSYPGLKAVDQRVWWDIN